MPVVRMIAVLGTLIGAAALGREIVVYGRSPAEPSQVEVQAGVATVQPSPTLGLSMPIDCTIGLDCEVQNYVDRDDTSGASDFRHGTLTYDGHNGVDFRLKDLAAQRQGVNVLAAADGVVLRIRDDVADVSVNVLGRASVASQECGNGLVVDHPGGISTQYCHMARASLVVRPGDLVRAGDALGKVGLSGLTEYPHLHFVVRRDGVVIDPFLPAPVQPGPPGASLWTADAAARLGYRARVVLNAGFSSSPVSGDQVEAGSVNAADRAGPALVAYVRALGLKAGDVQTLELTGPDGAVIAATTSNPLPRNQAQRLLYVGSRTRTGWAAGAYVATYRVLSGGEVVLDTRFQTVL